MSKISTFKRFVLEELPSEVRAAFTKLIGPLNSFQEQVYFALTNGLTVRDNLKSQVISISIDVSQTYPITAKYTLNEKPVAVLLASIVETGTGSPGVVPAHSHQWLLVNGTLELTFSGLDAAKRYSATLIALV